MTTETTNETNNPVTEDAPVEGLPQAPETLSSGEGPESVPTEPSQEEQVEQLIIGEELTEDDLNRVYKRLGRPDEPDQYDLSEIVPPEYDQTAVEQFKQKAFENGMSQEGVKKMAEWYKEVEVANLQKMEEARKQQADLQILELKKDFGVNFDREVNNARKALDAYTDNDFRKYMDDTGLGNHPALVKAFAKIGRELSEDRLVQSETAQRLAKNEELKKSEIARLRSDKAFMEKYRRGDAVAVQRLNRLYLED